MLEKVRKYIELHHMINVGERIVMGISGGADSVALFLILNELKGEYDLELFVVHINHGIRKEANGDADYVAALCKQYQVPFYLYEADVKSLAREQGKSEEEMGREYRYQCFYEIMEKEHADKLAVAHHMGDRAETVLFHLVRGTDLSGAIGIRPVNDKIIRPLLECQKEELTGWLEERQIMWKEDITNGDNSYTRNKIRNQVLPLLTEVNGQAVKHIAEYADCMTEYEAFFQKAVQQYIEEQVVFKEERSSCHTNVITLLSQEKILGAAVLYEMLTKTAGQKKDISKDHILSIYALLGKQSGKRVDLPYQVEAKISYEKLIIRKCSKQEDFFSWKREVPLEELRRKKEQITLNLPYSGRLTVKIYPNDNQICKNNYTKYFDCDKIKDTLFLRTVESADYMVINEHGNRKKLSRYFIDERIPSAMRRTKIVAAIGNEVLWVLGNRRCENYKIDENTKYILALTYEGEKNDISY